MRQDSVVSLKKDTSFFIPTAFCQKISYHQITELCANHSLGEKCKKVAQKYESPTSTSWQIQINLEKKPHQLKTI